MSPFNSSNIIFRKICTNHKIPFATWMHGGYGLAYSFPGYDVTDFRFCKNHITYGSYLKDIIEDDKCILNELELRKNQKIFL